MSESDPYRCAPLSRTWRTGTVALSSLLGIHLLALLQVPLLLLPARWRLRPSRALTRPFLHALDWALRTLGVATISFSPDLKEALQTLALEPRPMIVCANHPGFLDALVLMARLRQPCCVVKADLRRVPGLAVIIRANCWPTNDDPLTLHRQLQRELAANRPVLLLPEGTRTPRSERLGRLRAGVGVALLARETGTPLLPIRIELEPHWPAKGDSLVRCPPLPIAYGYHLAGTEFVVPPDEHPKRSVDRLAELLSALPAAQSQE